ncbi:MAG: formate dehydrogenase accessory protein FdhE [Gammaproteobacteria bacterium]|nr:formate dehydrogenase accessory protein FdhE [Gammaproteobacteria bacterium]
MNTLAELERRNPEWRPWLAVVAEALAAIDDPAWSESGARRVTQPDPRAPLLAGAMVSLRAQALSRLLEKLTRRIHPPACAFAAFAAGLNGDEDRLAELVGDEETEAGLFRAIADLLPMPFLHACRAQWSSALPRDWSHGHCPVCGRWPALAELCGVERARYLRCGGCGAAWRIHGLSCAYCSLTDHAELGSLVVEQRGAAAAIEVCNRCRGYLKTFTRLQASAPTQILLDDLASVELDLAAADRDYRRPQGAGYVLGVTFADADAVPKDSLKDRSFAIPAKAGIQVDQVFLDARLRGQGDSSEAPEA